METISHGTIALQKIVKKHLVSKLRTKLKYATTLGFILALCAAAFSALPNVIPKSLMEDNADGITPHPIMLVFVIYVINGLFFTPLAKNTTPVNKIGRKSITLLILLGVVEGSGTLLHMMGLKETTALNASILGNGEIIFAILIGITIFKERLNKKEMIPFLLIILGTVIIPVGSDIHNHGLYFSDFVLGDALILLAGLFYSLDTFIAKLIPHSISTKRVVHIMSCSGAVFTLILMLTLHIPFDIDLDQLSIISVSGFLGIGVTMVFFVMALRLIGAVRTVLIYSAGTVFSIIYSTTYLSETITMLHVFSLLVVIFGLYSLRTRLGKEQAIKN